MSAKGTVEDVNIAKKCENADNADKDKSMDGEKNVQCKQCQKFGQRPQCPQRQHSC